MPYIHLTTFVAAPIERVFDLSRSIDLHKQSMQRYNEVAIGEKRSGLLKAGDEVIWQAKHLFKERKLKIKITDMKPPFSFIDEQVDGDFVKMKHEHYFKELQNGTFMIDQFHFDIPYGKLGALFNKVYFTRYMQRLLEERNEQIKKVAEGAHWKPFLQ